VSAFFSAAVLVALLRAPKLRKMSHFQLVWLIASCEVVASVLLVSIHTGKILGARDTWTTVLYVWGVQVCRLSSSGLFVSLVTVIFVIVKKPHMYSVNAKRKRAVLFIAGGVFCAAAIICTAAYLIDDMSLSSSMDTSSGITGQLGFVVNFVFALFFAWSLLVVAFVIRVLRVGVDTTDVRVLRARSSVGALVALVVVYHIPDILDFVVVRPLLAANSAYWRACAQLWGGAVVQTGGLACLLVWWRQLYHVRPEASPTDTVVTELGGRATSSSSSMLRTTAVTTSLLDNSSSLASRWLTNSTFERYDSGGITSEVDSEYHEISHLEK
jgi:hypothetical protein